MRKYSTKLLVDYLETELLDDLHAHLTDGWELEQAVYTSHGKWYAHIRKVI